MRNKFIIFLIALLIVGCKYEDGPLISFVAIPKRVVGDYHIEKVSANGIDITSQIETLNIDYFHFDDDHEAVGGDGQFQTFFTDTTSQLNSGWALSYTDKKEKIVFQTFGCFFGGNGVPVDFQPLPGFLSHGDCEPPIYWDIKKLSNCKMWLSINFDNNQYEVHLKKI